MSARARRAAAAGRQRSPRCLPWVLAGDLPAACHRRTGAHQPRVAPTSASDRLLAQLAPLTLGQPAPDPEALVVRERVVQALGADLAAEADLLGLAGAAALLREE